LYEIGSHNCQESDLVLWRVHYCVGDLFGEFNPELGDVEDNLVVFSRITRSSQQLLEEV